MVYRYCGQVELSYILEAAIRISTLLYHHINTRFANNITLTPSEFRLQLEFLRRNDYRVISLATALEYLHRGQAVPARSVLLTFDDGYEDFYTTAFPILQEFGYTATVFPIVGVMGQWNEWNRRAPYIAYHLSWSQINELAQQGISFGCHTMAHHSLVRFEEKRVRYELETARDVLAQRIGQPVETLSYPYGDYNGLTRRVAAQLFQAAFAVEQGAWDWRADPLAIRRLKVDPGASPEQFGRLLNSPVDDDKIKEAAPPAADLPDIKT